MEAEPEPEPIRYPVRVQLTSSDGKELKVSVHARQGEKLLIVRDRDGKFFELDLSRLSNSSQEQVRVLPEVSGEVFDERKQELAVEAALVTRTVHWRRSFREAHQEAGEYQLPILLVHLPSDGTLGEQLDREVFNTVRFREWAQTRFVLLLDRATSFTTSNSAGDSASLDRRVTDLEARYRIDPESVTLVYLDENGTLVHRETISQVSTFEQITELSKRFSR